ncbi:MAG: phosphatase PAP2 family protein [Elusimicrobia bacterium]|nr:phosphatase PAP2 family protein [Elusimicrobiota bacterium]
MPGYTDLTIIIPTINEKDNLEILLPVLENLYPGAGIFITDDGSDDGTDGYIDSLIGSGFRLPLSLIDRKRGIIRSNDSGLDSSLFSRDILKIRHIPGLTASVLDAVMLSPKPKFAVIDADLQHPPELIRDMYDKLADADLVCAYRSDLGQFSALRKLISKTGIFIANSVLPVDRRVKDPLSGAFAGMTGRLKDILSATDRFRLGGFKILFDILKSAGGGLRIAQTGYGFQIRTRGVSKISWRHFWLFFESILDTGTKRLFTGGTLVLSAVFLGIIMILIFGDVNLSYSIRAAAKQSPIVMKSAKLLTDYGNQGYYLLFTGLMAYGLITKKKKFVRITLIYMAVQLVASILITGSIKIIAGRPRPGHGFTHDFFTGKTSFKSFPSGHATDAFSSAGVVWFFSPSYILSSVSFFYSSMIALSRIIVGAHYFLDVTAGMFIGFMTGIILSYRNRPDQ